MSIHLPEHFIELAAARTSGGCTERSKEDRSQVCGKIAIWWQGKNRYCRDHKAEAYAASKSSTQSQSIYVLGDDTIGAEQPVVAIDIERDEIAAVKRKAHSD